MWLICSIKAREYAAILARIDEDTMFWTLQGRWRGEVHAQYNQGKSVSVELMKLVVHNDKKKKKDHVFH